MNFPNATATRPVLASTSGPAGRIHDMFPPNSAVALFGVGHPATTACEQVASQLSLLKKRVVIVPVLAVLNTKPLPDPNLTGAKQAEDGTFWIWPTGRARTFEGYSGRTSQSAVDWLFSLRSSFDSVLLDCPDPETTPGCAAIALMAQSALLAVEANQASKQNILKTQQVLQSSGIRLDASILVQHRREP